MLIHELTVTWPKPSQLPCADDWVTRTCGDHDYNIPYYTCCMLLWPGSLSYTHPYRGLCKGSCLHDNVRLNCIISCPPRISGKVTNQRKVAKRSWLHFVLESSLPKVTWPSIRLSSWPLTFSDLDVRHSAKPWSLNLCHFSCSMNVLCIGRSVTIEAFTLSLTGYPVDPQGSTKIDQLRATLKDVPSHLRNASSCLPGVAVCFRWTLLLVETWSEPVPKVRQVSVKVVRLLSGGGEGTVVTSTRCKIHYANVTWNWKWKMTVIYIN